MAPPVLPASPPFPLNPYFVRLAWVMIDANAQTLLHVISRTWSANFHYDFLNGLNIDDAEKEAHKNS